MCVGNGATFVRDELVGDVSDQGSHRARFKAVSAQWRRGATGRRFPVQSHGRLSPVRQQPFEFVEFPGFGETDLLTEIENNRELLEYIADESWRL